MNSTKKYDSDSVALSKDLIEYISRQVDHETSWWTEQE